MDVKVDPGLERFIKTFSKGNQITLRKDLEDLSSIKDQYIFSLNVRLRETNEMMQILEESEKQGRPLKKAVDQIIFQFGRYKPLS